MDEPKRPKTRSECQRGPRPCPWVSCRYSTFFDIPHSDGKNRLKVLASCSVYQMDAIVDGWLESWQYAPYSCVLDATDDGRKGSDVVAETLGVREPVINTTVERSLRKLEEEAKKEGLLCSRSPRMFWISSSPAPC